MENKEINLKHALLIVFTETQFTELMRVAQLLRQSNQYTPSFVFADTYKVINRDLAVCQKEKISCFDAKGNLIVLSNPMVQNNSVSTQKPPEQRPLKTWKQKVYDWRAKKIWAIRIWLRDRLPLPIKDFLSYLVFRLIPRIIYYIKKPFYFLLSLAFWLHYFAHQVRFASQFIAQKKAHIIILAVDVAGYSTGAWIKAAQRHGIASVIVPFAMADIATLAKDRFEHPDHNLKKWGNRLVGKMYPHWVYDYQGRQLLFMSGTQVLAKQWLGLAPPLPWVYNSTRANALIVENEFMLEHYQQEGMTKDNLVMTGALYDDILAENLHNTAARRLALCQKLGMPTNKRLILGALTPDKFASPDTKPDFESYADLVQFWVQSLATLSECNIVIRLHPSLKYEDMKYIEQWGVKIAQQDTATLIPLCDIYVVDCSATTRWAVACGKPVINYDMYHYRLPYYEQGDGVLTMEKQEEFIDTLQRLTKDADFYAEIARRQKACAHKFGQLDGLAGTRMLQLFDKLTINAK